MHVLSMPRCESYALPKGILVVCDLPCKSTVVVFCRDASLTTEMGCFELHSSRSWLTGLVCLIGPKRGHCHGLKDCRNCWVNNLKYWSVGLVLIVVRVATTGKSMRRWCVSVSVTRGPEKFWFVGMVEKG